MNLHDSTTSIKAVFPSLLRWIERKSVDIMRPASFFMLLLLSSCFQEYDRTYGKRDIRTVAQPGIFFDVHTRADYLGKNIVGTVFLAPDQAVAKGIATERYEQYLSRGLEEIGYKIVISETVADVVIKYKYDDFYSDTQSTLVSVPVLGERINPFTGYAYTAVVGAGTETQTSTVYGGYMRLEGHNRLGEGKTGRFESYCGFQADRPYETDAFMPFVIMGALKGIEKRITKLEKFTYNTSDQLYKAIRELKEEGIDGLLPELKEVKAVKIVSGSIAMGDICEAALKNIDIVKSMESNFVITINQVGNGISAEISGANGSIRKINVPQQQGNGFDEYEMTNLALSILFFGEAPR